MERPLAPLPLRQTVSAVLQAIYAHGSSMSPLALVPSLIAVALTAGARALGSIPWVGFFAMGVNLYLLVWFASAVFRLLLRGQGPDLNHPLPRWGPAEGRLALRGLGLLVLAM